LRLCWLAITGFRSLDVVEDLPSGEALGEYSGLFL